jgi:positive regulator of sigma E activity
MLAEHRQISHAADCLMTADATVVAVRANGSVDLEFAPLRQCGACAGTCLWKRLSASRLEQLQTDSPLACGTRVEVSLPERRVAAVSLLVHGVPLAAILIGAAIGTAVWRSDVGTLVGALAAIAVAALGFARFRRRLERAVLSGLIVRRSA